MSSTSIQNINEVCCFVFWWRPHDEFGQDVVWRDQKQQQLIDSLMNNYYIPPLIFGECPFSCSLEWPLKENVLAVTERDGEETRVCIDGKQRLSSIQRCVYQLLLCATFLTVFEIYGRACEWLYDDDRRCTNIALDHA